jgi:hypothetical protein
MSAVPLQCIPCDARAVLQNHCSQQHLLRCSHHHSTHTGAFAIFACICGIPRSGTGPASLSPFTHMKPAPSPVLPTAATGWLLSNTSCSAWPNSGWQAPAAVHQRNAPTVLDPTPHTHCHLLRCSHHHSTHTGAFAIFACLGGTPKPGAGTASAADIECLLSPKRSQRPALCCQQHPAWLRQGLTKQDYYSTCL